MGGVAGRKYELRENVYMRWERFPDMAGRVGRVT